MTAPTSPPDPPNRLVDRRGRPYPQWFTRFNGLRGRMAMLLLVTLLLPFGYAVFHAADQYRHKGERLQLDLQRTARLIADHHAHTLGNLRTWLEHIAREDDAAWQGDDCNTRLRDRLSETRLIAGLALADRSGEIVCAAMPEDVGVGVIDRLWFRRAALGEPFTVSELLTLRLAGQPQSLVVSVPVYAGQDWLTDRRRPQAVLAAALDLDAFAVSWRMLDLPVASEAYLVDRTGSRLRPTTNAPPIERREIEALLRGEEPIAEIERADSGRMLVAAAPVGTSGLAVVAGLAVADHAWLSAEAAMTVLIPAGMLVLAVIVIWLATHLLVNRHVQALALAVRRHQPGRSLAATLNGAPNELQDLCGRFIRLASDLEERESSLQRALAQKELLLKEVNHRVKNNLQIVASLMRLRARTEPTAQSRAALRDAHARIEAIALVHRRIYEQDALERVELQGFLGELLDLLVESFGNERTTIGVGAPIPSLWLPTDQAVSIALLVTELVSNSLEHAFVGRARGHVTVTVVIGKDGLTLTVADNGVGFEEAELRNGTGTGTTLAEMLVQQMQGQIDFASSASGSRITVGLPLSEPSVSYAA